MFQKAFLAALTFACAPLSACFSLPLARYEAASTESFARIPAGEDSMEWIVIEHRLCNLQSDADEDVRAMLERKAYWPGSGWRVDVGSADFRDQVEKASAKEKPAYELLASLHVVEARLVLDEQGDPTLWRRMRLEHYFHWLNVLGAVPFSSTGPERDALTSELLERAKADGLQFWTLDADGLVFQGPVSPEFAERCRLAWSSTPLIEQSFDGTTLKLKIPLGSDRPWFASPVQTAACNGAVQPLPYLEAHGLKPESVESYRELRASAGLP